MPRNRRLLEALDRLAAEEQAFLESEFLAPVVRGRSVRVRIAGVVCTVEVRPADFRGWGVFRPVSHAEARLTRTARPSERAAYLKALPRTALTLIRELPQGDWLGLAAQASGTTPGQPDVRVVALAEKARPFDRVFARFDGATAWYEVHDPAADPTLGAYLRRSRLEQVDPAALTASGLTPEQRRAYERAMEADGVSSTKNDEERLRRALTHGGARLRDFSEQDGAYLVQYEVDSRRHVSVVDRNDLTVRSAGICLSGLDTDFDLQSLVGVLREFGQDP